MYIYIYIYILHTLSIMYNVCTMISIHIHQLCIMYVCMHVCIYVYIYIYILTHYKPPY